MAGFVAFLGKIFADKRIAFPIRRFAEVLDRVILDTRRPVTVTIVVETLPPSSEVAVMVALPTPTPVARPLTRPEVVFTVAIVVFELLNLTV